MKTKVPRTVVVTGASAGIGRAIARAFASQGWQVALLARGAEGLESARQEIERLGSNSLAIQVDVGDALALMRAAERIENELGSIDVWINNAMVTVYSAIVDVSAAEFEQVTRVTYLGQVYGTLAALKYMRPRNQGVIIYIGSALAYRSIPYQGPYCAAKAAVRGFVDSLRSELLSEHSHIRVSMVHLPAVNTPQFDWARNKLGREAAPVSPIIQPEIVADAVVRAVSKTPREIWLGFSTVKAIVAQIIMPGVLDRLLAKAGTGNVTTTEHIDEARQDNLFDAGRGDPGSHGNFDRQASPRAFPFNPMWLRVGLICCGALITAAVVSSVSNPYSKLRNQGLPDPLRRKHHRLLANNGRVSRMKKRPMCST